MSTGNQQLLQRYAQPIFTSSDTDDVNSPFSYRDWYNAHQGIVPGQEFKQYNEYLTNWYKKKNEEITDFNLILKLNYLTLLKQLQLFFSREEAENWYNQVNIDNEKELLLAIPYFARKLKDISLYYLQLRNNIKESRLKYNQVGTNTGTIQQLQKFILTNYTKKPNNSITLPSSIWKNVPELSSVRESITIQVEELYDLQDYFDQVPTLPVSAYYNIDNNELNKFLTSKGLEISDAEWIYKLGAFDLTSEEVSLSGEDISDLSELLTQKYLGQNKYTTTTATFSAKTDLFDINIAEGNNFFYWPQGPYKSKASNSPRYQKTDINSAGLNTVATAGSSIELADVIFTKSTQGIEGAWLRNQAYDFQKQNVEAYFEAADETTFRFPFPGYGLSAEDTSWSGYSLVYEPRFFFLDRSLQEAVEETYWSTDYSALTAVEPININDTTLVANKAYANRNYNQADRISVWPNPPLYNSTSFSGPATEAWLYRMNNTDISIGIESDNTIVWPFEKINSDEPFPDYYAKNLTDVCTVLPVSSIDFSYAVASTSLSSADVIYKLTNYKHTSEDAIECCWLSGEEIHYPEKNLIATKQNNFQLFLNSGFPTTFIWNGINDTNLENVFKTIKHQPDCSFIKKPNATYEDFNLCTCKQVSFVPFGHPGNNYQDYNSFADFIFEGEFVPGVTDLTQYLNTSAFAWYKTTSEIGFGDGRWYSGELSSDNQFFLQEGKVYTYYRALIQKKDTDDVILPSYVVRYKLNNQTQNAGQWIRAIKTTDGDWVSTGQTSPMTLSPGEIISYNRARTSSYNITGTNIEYIDVSENRGSIWSNYDYLTIDDKTFKQVAISFPYSVASNINTEDPYNQYPALNITTLFRVKAWSITNPNNVKQTFLDTPVILFTPTLTGLYTIALTAISATSLLQPSVTGWYYFSNIPPITADPTLQEVPALTSYYTPVPGYTLNTKLYGWDYGAGAYNPFARSVNAGAKPFWAKLYTDRDENTGYKGILSYGTPQRFVDDHNIITQPDISDLILESGNKITYTRNYPVPLEWVQPVDLTVAVNTSSWCTLEFNTTSDSNISFFLENYKNDLVITPTTATSQIKLQNYIDNKPVEIHYNAIAPFIWNVTAIPVVPETIFSDVSATISIFADAPWTNLSNKFFPTVAAFPALDKLYSGVDLGGYFIPKNLGASVYINQDYTATLDLTSSSLSSSFQDITKQFEGRGLTKLDQPTPYIDIVENNIWLKEPTVAGPIAGTSKKKAFKKYQKFIPYQSGYETNPRLTVGLLTPTSRQTPWTGEEASVWGDSQNFPQSPTGEINVQAWADSQILKKSGLQLDNWCTDIFGNQYGLYKGLAGTSPYTRRFTTGEIWVRKNSQFAAPASIGLKDVFDTYKNTSIINELTGYGVRKIDMFFDTLYIETSGAVIFEKINYDYTNDNIFSLTDEARYVSLAMPVVANLNKEFESTNLSNFTFARAGDTWFFPKEKLVTLSICGVKEKVLTPELYELDLNTLTFKKIFPVDNDSISTISELSGLNIVSIDPPVLSHNTLRKEYLLTILGKNSSNKSVVIEITIKDLSQLTIKEVIVYTPLPDNLLLDPPVVTQELYTNISITNIEYQDALNFQCNAENGTIIFEPVSLPSWVSLSPNGAFTGTPPFKSDRYFADFKVTNEIGPSFYSLIIDVNYTEILTLYYLTTEGYSVSGGDGYLVQEEHDLGDLETNVVSRIIE